MRYPADKPCPFPGQMVIVDTREGAFWRMKPKVRAGVDGMNAAMKANMGMMSVLSPAAAKLVRELKYCLNGMKCGRITVSMKNCLHRSVKETGGLNYSYFAGFTFQPRYRLDRLLLMSPSFRVDGKYVVMKVDIPETGAVRKRSALITGYRLVMVMVVGNPIGEGEVDVFEVMSPLYESERAVEEGCVLRMVIPDGGEPWMVLLRIVSYEGRHVALSPRHAGMKLVGWG
jgi:hypothetical protein